MPKRPRSPERSAPRKRQRRLFPPKYGGIPWHAYVFVSSCIQETSKEWDGFTYRLARALEDDAATTSDYTKDFMRIFRETQTRWTLPLSTIEVEDPDVTSVLDRLITSLDGKIDRGETPPGDFLCPFVAGELRHRRILDNGYVILRNSARELLEYVEVRRIAECTCSCPRHCPRGARR